MRAATATVALLSLPLSTKAHPLCWYGPDRAVSTTAKATFCPNKMTEGFCCEPDEEEALRTMWKEAAVSAECADIYKEVRVCFVFELFFCGTHVCRLAHLFGM